MNVENIEICGLLFAFNGLFFTIHRHASSPFGAVFNVSPIKTL